MNKKSKVLIMLLVALLILGAIVALQLVSKKVNSNQIVSSRTSSGSLNFFEGSHYKGDDISAPVRFITDHEINIRGDKITYKAIAGETYIYNLQGEPTASMFSYSYIKNVADTNQDRPVAFIFNGGPGSSSLWLHMGIIGPRKVVLSNDINPKVTPPFQIVDNENSLLDIADLVFIDPVGTGYSQAIGVGKNEDFYGVDKDAEATAQFISHWLKENNRWNSPKFVIGESYGSIRATVLPNALMGGATTAAGVFRGITLNGIILLGTTLDRDSNDVEMKLALQLPSIATTAWYHKQSGYQSLSIEKLHDEALNFAKTIYYPALQKEKSKTLDISDRKEIVKDLSKYTGLSETYFKDSISINTSNFSKLLLEKNGQHVGLYDSRYTLPSLGDGNEPVADDPAMGQYTPAFVAAFNQMEKEELKVTIDRPYNSIVWSGLNFIWDYSRKGMIPTKGFAYELASAMRRNPDLKVFVASGYYDLVTTPAAAKNSLEKAPVPHDRIFYKNYESGHMLYIGETAAQFSNDTHDLITSGKISNAQK